MEDISKTVHSLAQRYFGDYKVRGDEVVAEYCPFCKGGQNGDRNTFAINMNNGAYNCRRGSCNATGGINDILNFFGEENKKTLQMLMIVLYFVFYLYQMNEWRI